MSSGWKKQSSKEVHKNPWFSVTEDKVDYPDGARENYYVVRKPNCSVIIPFDGEEVYLVNVFRYPLGNHFWELPMGRSDNGENFLQTAQRELKEETGLTAQQWVQLGRFAPSPGDSDLTGGAFLAKQLTEGEPNRKDRGEQDMKVKKFTVSQVDEMISSGQIIDSWTIVPWYFFKEHLKKQ